jgi:hypothetical protein
LHGQSLPPPLELLPLSLLEDELLSLDELLLELSYEELEL